MTVNGARLDGPKLVEWLYDFAPRLVRDPSDRTPSDMPKDAVRQLHRWKQPGSTPHVYAVDEVLVELGLHLSDLPDHVWIDEPA